MKIVAIKEMSAGNESVGEMWKETAIFDGKTPLEEVMRWGDEGRCFPGRKNVLLSVAYENGNEVGNK